MSQPKGWLFYFYAGVGDHSYFGSGAAPIFSAGGFFRSASYALKKFTSRLMSLTVLYSSTRSSNRLTAAMEHAEPKGTAMRECDHDSLRESRQSQMNSRRTRCMLRAGGSPASRSKASPVGLVEELYRLTAAMGHAGN